MITTPTERFPIDQQSLEQSKVTRWQPFGRLFGKASVEDHSRGGAQALLRRVIYSPGWEEVASGILRVTFELPFGIDHVHCYFLRRDRQLDPRRHRPPARATPRRGGAGARELDAPVERIVVTHMHPDHVGGARDIAGLTGAPVFQGREDHAQCVRAWGERSPERFAAYWAAHGLPESHVQGLAQESDRLVAGGPLGAWTPSCSTPGTRSTAGA